MDNIKEISLQELDPHPNHPRAIFGLREDVVEGIAAQLRDSGIFDPAHALLVRPLNGRYQIVRGHHRAEAAKRAELETVPCWVREMSDEEAYMELVLGNAQGELSPLQIGIHAAGAVKRSYGGRGKDARSISGYARSIGKNQSYVSRLIQAAKVFNATISVTYSSMNRLQELAIHFYEISNADRELWHVLVRLMLDREWSAVETGLYIDYVNSLSISDKWQTIFLPIKEVVMAHLSKTSVENLISVSEGIEAMIDSYEVDKGKFKNEFHSWLTNGIGGYAWDIRELVAYQRQLQERLADAERQPPIIALEDWRTWLERQPNCDLLLTDPPYMTDIDNIDVFAKEWLPSALAKVKSDGRAYVCIGAYPEEIKAYLDVPLPEDIILANILVWTYENTLGPAPKDDYKLNWQAILYFRKQKAGPLNCPIMNEQFTVQRINAPDGRIGNRFHKWQKPDELAERLIMHSTKSGDLVLDPFAGTGTFLIVASKLGRIAQGCDTDPKMIKTAVSRGCKHV